MSYREIQRAATIVQIVETEHHRFEGRVLDVGCGAKPLKRLFPKLEWVGLDKRPVGDIEADFHDMPLEDASFDTVLCTDALQYAVDPAKVISEMARVLKQGGVLLVVVPNTDNDDGTALWGFRTAGLRHLLESEETIDVAQVLPVNSSWGGVISGYLKDFTESRNRSLNEELQGWVDDMDRRFPTMVGGAAIKK